MGPHFGLNYTSGLRWTALAGLRTIWHPIKEISVDVIVGGRLSETEIALLEPHLKYKSFAAQVNLELPYSFILEWSQNRYGTSREHVSLGYQASLKIQVDIAPGESYSLTVSKVRILSQVIISLNNYRLMPHRWHHRHPSLNPHLSLSRRPNQYRPYSYW